MNSPLPASAPAPRRNWTRRLVNLLVALVVIAVAAAAFVFSYDGLHAIALLGGMSKQLARYYPGLFDAVLVIACVATVMLRHGRWWARTWAWVVTIVVLAAIGAADVLHAISYTLPHRTTEGIVAAAPVVAVLLAFSLLLTLLRPYRTPDPEPVLTPLLEVQALPAAASPPIALPAASAPSPASAAAPAEAERAPEGRPAPDAPPTVESPAFAAAPEVPRAAAPTVPAAAHSATKPNEVIAPEGAMPPATRLAPEPSTPAPSAPEPPTREVPIPVATAAEAAAGAPAPGPAGEPAPPTVAVPALSPEQAVARPPARGPRSIRYAGGAAPGAAGKGAAGKQDADDTEQPAGYWEGGGDGQLAGLVYRAGEDHGDADDTRDQDAGARGDGDGDGGDDPWGEPGPRRAPEELEDDADAPSFATSPFAAVPRLNRVRSTPTPPADEDE